MEAALSFCTVEFCGRPVYAKGLCRAHYQRKRRNGTTTVIRDRVGPRRNEHPLYTRWFTILELARSEGVDSAWDLKRTPAAFDNFVRDVGGVPPSSTCRLLKKDPAKKIGPSNFIWVEKQVLKLPGETVNEYSKRQYRAYFRTNPKRYRDKNLKSKFGITSVEYDILLAAQGGVCAICKQLETATDQSGRVQNFCQDHRHSDNKLRGLLCRRCNRGLSFFLDTASLLREAANYLDRY